MFEDTFLFSDTIAANIAFADPDAPEIDRGAARLAGAHDFIAALPEGYETPIGERGFSLSGGQRQRIAIARAILADPRVLILDDATSSVDPGKEHEIRAAMAEVMQGRTTLVIAHRPATIALAERVVLLHAGHVVATGTHGDARRDERRVPGRAGRLCRGGGSVGRPRWSPDHVDPGRGRRGGAARCRSGRTCSGALARMCGRTGGRWVVALGSSSSGR